MLHCDGSQVDSCRQPDDNLTLMPLESPAVSWENIWLQQNTRAGRKKRKWILSRGFSASPALSSTFGFMNPVYTVDLTTTTGLSGEPLKMVSKGKKTDDF